MKHENLLKSVVPGFIPDVITPDQWYLGGTTKISGAKLNPGGQWVVPAGENQSNNFFDSYNCTGFGYTNRIECLWYKKNGVWRNFSDRWLAIVANTVPGVGNSPHTVAEAARKFGLLDERDLPFDSSIVNEKAFYSPKPPTRDLVAKGEKFLKEECEPQHDWVDSDPVSLMNALEYSPIGIAVAAWYRDTDGYYYSPLGEKPSHDTSLVGYEKGKYWLIYDSYPDENGSFMKKLRWDFNLPYKSKRYWLELPVQKKLDILQKIVDLIKSFLNIDINVEDLTPNPEKPLSERLAERAEALIGKDASPKNLAPQELSCAEGLSNIINSVLPIFPAGIESTVVLKEQLDKSASFERTVDAIKRGTIICSPRIGATYGHVGVFVDGQNIISNDSKTGTMQKNYTWETWTKEFKTKRGLRIFLWNS